MNEELLSKYVDRAAIESDTEFMVTQLKTLKESFDIIAGLKLQINGAQSLGQVSSALGQVKAAEDQVADSTDKLAAAATRVTNAQKTAAQVYDQLTGSVKKQKAAQDDAVSSAASSEEAYERITRALAQNQIESEKLREEQAYLKKNFTDGEISLQAYEDGLKKVKAGQAELKISNQDLNKALNNLEKESQAAGGSLNELRAQLALAQQAFDKLSAAERDTEAGQAIKKQVSDLNAQVTTLEQTTGRFQRNVGNYSGAFKEAFAVLKDQLTGLKSQMGDLETKGKTVVNTLTGGNPIGFDPNKFKGQVTSLAGTGGSQVNIAAGDAAAYQQITQKAQVLETELQKLSIGFKSTRQEERAFQEAAVNIGLALGQTDEKAVEFIAAVGEVKNSVGDIKSALKFQSQDGKGLQSLVSIVNGLVGAFGAAQAAVSLMGDDSEESQKQMAKLQQLLVLINGLQQVNNTLQEENGAIQGVLAARTALRSAALRIQNVLTTVAIETIVAETAANVDLAESEEVVAATTAEATVAQEEAVVAEAEAAVASTALTAVISGGLIVVLVAAAAAVAYLVSKLPGWIQGTALTIKQQEALADAAKKTSDVLKAQADLIEELDGALKRSYEYQLSASQAAGDNAYKQFALRKQIAIEEANLAKEQIDLFNGQGLSERKLAGDLDVLNSKRQAAIDIATQLGSIPKQDLTGDQKDQLEAANKNIDFYTKLYDSAKSSYDNIRGARVRLSAALTAQDLIDLEESKLAAEEQVAVALQLVKIKQEAIINANQLILSNEASTRDQRIAAEKAILAAQLATISAEAAAKLKDPGLTDAGKAQIERQAQADRAKAVQDGNEKVRLINLDYDKRDRDASAQALQDQLSDQVKADQVIIDNQKAGYEKRLDALVDSYGKQKEIIGSQMFQELADQSLTEEQRKAIIAKYNSQLLDAAIKFETDRRKIIQDNQEKILADAQAFYQLRQAQINKDQSDELIALNESAGKNIISIQGYEKKRQDIEQKYAVQRLQTQIAEDHALVLSKKTGTNERAKAEEQLSKDVLALSDLTTQKQIADHKKLVKAYEDDAFAIQDALFAVVESGLESEKNAIQKQIDLIEEQKNAAVDAENASGDAAQLKANRIATINAKAQADTERLQLKQKQLDIQKAKFEKARSIAEIIEKTAIAVSDALPDIPLSIAVGLIGAAQLATVIATPIPQYKTGTPESGHPGGGAIVGDGGRPEPIILPNGDTLLSPSTATFMDLPKGTIVMPSLDDLRADMERMSFKRIPVYTGQVADNGSARMTARLETSLRQVQQEIRNKPVAIVKNTYTGVQVSYQTAQSRWEWVNRNMQS